MIQLWRIHYEAMRRSRDNWRFWFFVLLAAWILTVALMVSRGCV